MATRDQSGKQHAQVLAGPGVGLVLNALFTWIVTAASVPWPAWLPLLPIVTSRRS